MTSFNYVDGRVYWAIIAEGRRLVVEKKLGSG